MAADQPNSVVKVEGFEVRLHSQSPTTIGIDDDPSSEESESGTHVGSEGCHSSISPLDDTDVELGGDPQQDEEWQQAFARQRAASAGVWCLVSLSAAAVLCLVLLSLRNDKGLSAVLSRAIDAALALRLGGYR
ncbi:uncharacterized protein [Dermacentor albipictus]|uniref:uncharacterized protein n=1 Tax=Dermacentor albipictus TaxID=60249 RepID=UPI0038FC4BFA